MKSINKALFIFLVVALAVITIALNVFAIESVCPVNGGEHSFSLYRTIKDPNCIEDGKGDYICLECSATVTKDIPSVAHNDNNSDGKCDSCGYYFVKNGVASKIATDGNGIAVLIFTPEKSGVYQLDYSAVGIAVFGADAHDTIVEQVYGNRVKAPFIANESYYIGLYNFSSSSNVKIMVSLINECTHNNLEIYDEKKGDCYNSGLTGGVYCNDCGYWIDPRETISAFHNWSEWVTVAPDCANGTKGYDERVCQVCGKYEKTNTVAASHEYIYETIPATINSSGYDRKFCVNCGYQQNYETIPRISYISLSSTTVTYNGKVRTPSVEARNSNWNHLTKGVSYDYEYLDGDMKYPGVYRVRVTFKGRYAGQVILKFIINPSQPKKLIGIGSYTYVELRWDAVEGADVYRIYQVYNGKEELLDVVSDTTYKVRNLIPGERYAFYVQAGKAHTISTEPEIPETQLTSAIVTTKPTATQPTTRPTTSGSYTEPLTTNPYITEPTVRLTTQPTTTAHYVYNTAQVESYGEKAEYLWGDFASVIVYTMGAPICNHIDNNADRICDICDEEALIFAGNYANYIFKLYVDGTLVINGSGIVYCRWNKYRDYIKNVEVEEGITGLAPGCFAVCKNLENISLPSTLTKIADEAFYSCTSIKSIDIPSSVSRLGYSVFSGCVSIEKLIVPEGIVELGYYFASGCTSLKEVVLPKSLVLLGDGAFAYCTALEEIILPENLFRIDGAFYGCSNLKRVVLPESLGKIGSGSFFECTALRDINFPSNLGSIGDEAFCGCESLTSAELPDSIMHIGHSAFAGCTDLEKISVGNGVTYLGYYFASGCVSLREVNLPSALEILGEGAFAYCFALEEIVLPESLKRIDGAFTECTSLKRIKLPANLKTIGYCAFTGCSSLEEIKLPDNLLTIGGWAFQNCSALKNIKIPMSVNNIGDGAFYRCHNLTSVDLGGIRELPYRVFADCIRLKEIEIPATVNFIDRNAFNNCIRLNRITVYNPDCVIESYIETFPEKALLCGYDYSTLEKYADDWMRNFAAFSGVHTHRYAERITAKATCDKDGELTYVCPCGDSYTESLPATGHKFESDKCIICGYESADDCDCSCHGGGFAKFIFNFILFFQKLFGLNSECECGVKHY